MILLEHGIPHESFSGKVLACLPPDDWKITPENSVGRKDLRHLPVLSIDPPGCKDIDDALHARTLDNGNVEVRLCFLVRWEQPSCAPYHLVLVDTLQYLPCCMSVLNLVPMLLSPQVGVHIADVTHFVAAGSALDEEAALRSTSTYLVERRLDMLPGILTETLCSLKPNVDRYYRTHTSSYRVHVRSRRRRATVSAPQRLSGPIPCILAFVIQVRIQRDMGDDASRRDCLRGFLQVDHPQCSWADLQRGTAHAGRS